MCILGRDILDHFDVIVSRRRDQVLLVAGNHHYVGYNALKVRS
jgi:hypothetical protein